MKALICVMGGLTQKRSLLKKDKAIDHGTLRGPPEGHPPAPQETRP